MSPTKEPDIEALRHSYRIREIFIDKGILAVLIAVVIFLGNAKLEVIRASQERLRVLAESEITAHEETWKALMVLRRLLAPLRESALDEQSATALTKAIFDFGEKVDGNSLYLAEGLRTRLNTFVDPKLADFVVAWESSADGRPPANSWQALDSEMEAIGEAIRAEVYRRRAARGEP